MENKITMQGCPHCLDKDFAVTQAELDHGQEGCIDCEKCGTQRYPRGSQGAKYTDAKYHLLIGVYPTGFVFADRSRRDGDGDYLTVALLPFDCLILKIRKLTTPEMLGLIRDFYETIAAHKGERYPISASGQYVILGKDARCSKCKHITDEGELLWNGSAKENLENPEYWLCNSCADKKGWKR